MRHGSGEIVVGVKALREDLSTFLRMVEQGAELVITRRGKCIARLGRHNKSRSFEDLERRGLVRYPTRPRRARSPSIKAQGSVSDLVAEQRR
jgi:antitoxin (DNA-binding transcriptional repressor) of toxin-antitoxin stability system